MIGLNRAFAAGAAAFLAIALVACSENDNAALDNRSGELPGGKCVIPAGPLAVAISRRTNSPGDLPDLAKQIVQRHVTSIPARVTGPELSLINVDGRPDVSQSGKFYSDAGNTQARQDDQQNFVSGFINQAAIMRAGEPEVDILATLV